VTGLALCVVSATWLGVIHAELLRATGEWCWLLVATAALVLLLAALRLRDRARRARLWARVRDLRDGGR